MAVFVDTSAIYAALSARDVCHPAARAQWERLLDGDEPLVTTSYVLVETYALLGQRLGAAAVRDFDARMLPLFEVRWIDAAMHERAVAALLAANRRDLSLVDCASFETMRARGLSTVFAFDEHFAAWGFRCLPDAD